MTEQEEKDLANFGIRVCRDNKKDEYVTSKKVHIEFIYNLSNALWERFAKEHPSLQAQGACGKSGWDHTEKFLDDGYSELLGAIGNLQSIASIMLKKRNTTTNT